MLIGQKIREYRKNKKLTQRELADLSSVSIVSIQQYERAVRTPHVNQLQKIAAALDISVEQLLDNESLVSDKHSVGTYIKELRKKTTLEQVERETGISRSRLSRIEHGELIPDAETIKKLSDGLNIPLDNLMIEAGYMKTISLPVRTGIKLQVCRVNKEYSLEYMANELDISVDYLLMLETGVVDASFSILEKYSSLSDFSVEFFTGDVSIPGRRLYPFIDWLDDNFQPLPIPQKKKIIDLLDSIERSFNKDKSEYMFYSIYNYVTHIRNEEIKLRDKESQTATTATTATTTTTATTATVDGDADA